MTALTPFDRATALHTLPKWSFDEDRNALFRQLRFIDFGAAMAAMVRIGVAAEKLDHHPEWTNIYSRIDVWLTTHDAGGVSARDVDLARLIDAWY